MNLSPRPYLEDWHAHSGAVSISAFGDNFLLSGMGARLFLECTAEELPELVRLCGRNAAAFSEYCRRIQPQRVVRTSEPISLTDLGL